MNLLIRSTKSVKKGQARRSYKFLESFIEIMPFMYSVRNLVRFSIEKKPAKKALALPWKVGSMKVEGVELEFFCSFRLLYCNSCSPLAYDLVGISGELA